MYRFYQQERGGDAAPSVDIKRSHVPTAANLSVGVAATGDGCSSRCWCGKHSRYTHHVENVVRPHAEPLSGILISSASVWSRATPVACLPRSRRVICTQGVSLVTFSYRLVSRLFYQRKCHRCKANNYFDTVNVFTVSRQNIISWSLLWCLNKIIINKLNVCKGWQCMTWLGIYTAETVLTVQTLNVVL